MQPVATSIEEGQLRFTDAVPLSEVFDKFRQFSEAVFSGGTSLNHILNAPAPTSKVAHWRTSEIASDPEGVERRKPYERRKLVEGLAIYLFDRFIRNNDGTLGNVFLRTPTGDSKPLAHMALFPVGDHDFGSIITRDFPPQVRTRLLEIAGRKRHRYAFVDMDLWEVHLRKELLTSPLEEDHAAAILEELAPYQGMPLYFRGKNPTKKEIAKILGQSTRFSDDHIHELVERLHTLFRLTPEGELYQSKAAARIGVPVNTRKFREIWTQFISELPSEDRSRLPTRGKPSSSRRRAR